MKLKLVEDYICEMAKIGFFNEKVGDSEHKTGFKVFVTNDSRPLAHIHIISQNKEKKVCVRCDKEPRYFVHKGYPDKFTNKEAIEFNNFLKSKYKYPQVFLMGDMKFNVQTYWEYTIYQWKLENDDNIDNLPLKTDKDGFVIFPKQPNYAQINNNET